MRGQHAPAALYSRERPGTHCIGSWVGPRAGLERCGKFPPPPGFDPRTVQPVASRYTDYATRLIAFIGLYMKEGKKNIPLELLTIVFTVSNWMRKSHLGLLGFTHYCFHREAFQNAPFWSVIYFRPQIPCYLFVYLMTATFEVQNLLWIPGDGQNRKVVFSKWSWNRVKGDFQVNGHN